MESIKVIGFDADDTLWVDGLYYKEAENSFCDLLKNFMSEKEISEKLFQTEMKNMELYGYGAMAYTLSMIETALRISNGLVPATVIDEIIKIGRSMLNRPIKLVSGVNDVLSLLQDKYRLVVVTKGDLLDQERKLRNSGLLHYFNRVEVLSEKQESHYLHLIHALDIQPSEFLMVGNSLKSDILPVLAIGGKAVHVPMSSVWQQESAENPSPSSYLEISTLSDLPGVLSL